MWAQILSYLGSGRTHMLVVLLMDEELGWVKYYWLWDGMPIVSSIHRRVQC